MRIESSYLLAGPEAGKRASFIAEVKAAIAAGDGEAPEEHRLYAADASVGELLSLLRNGSLFSSRRLVEYRGAELVRGKEDLAALAAYIAAPAEGAVLLLETESFYAEKPIEEAIGKERKKTFYELFENEKPRWVEKRIRELGLGIDEEGVEILLELIENDTEELETACSRLALLFPAGTVLGSADVEAVLSRNRQEDAFSLFARMASDEPEWALEALDTVLQDRQGGAVQILAALVWSFRRLLRLERLVADGDSFDTACLKSGIRAKSLQALHRGAMSRYPLEDCERIIRLASEVDGMVRSSGSGIERTVLELFVLGAMTKKGRLELSAPVL
jgi:DNA polymerase III subunit delta